MEDRTVSERLDTWMAGYLTAWRSNDPDHIAALFTDDAVYDPQTGSGTWSGHEGIISGWLAAADEPDGWTFTWEPLVETDDLAVITGTTVYEEPRDYRNLWEIHFAADGRCHRFVEWFIATA
jgi:uncharacterized protein (TIGR02246 family)